MSSRTSSRAWKRLLLGLAVLILFSGGALIHIGGGPSRLLMLLRGMNPTVIAGAFLLLFIGEIVKSWRLSFIAGRLGYQLPVRVSALARFSGRLVGVLTPAYSGSTPTRSLVISAYTGMPPGTSFGLATMESLLDTLVSVFFTIVFTIPLLPRSWLILLVSICIGFSWIMGVLWARSNSFSRFIKSLHIPDKAKCFILRQRERFLEGLRDAARLGILTPSLLITLASHVIEAMALLVVLSSDIYSVLSVWLVLKSFILMEATYVLTMSITPGGSLFFEYGLAGLMSPASLLSWRVVYLLFSILPGLIIVLAIRSVRRYIEEAVNREEVEACEENSI